LIEKVDISIVHELLDENTKFNKKVLAKIEKMRYDVIKLRDVYDNHKSSIRYLKKNSTEIISMLEMIKEVSELKFDFIGIEMKLSDLKIYENEIKHLQETYNMFNKKYQFFLRADGEKEMKLLK